MVSQTHKLAAAVFYGVASVLVIYVNKIVLTSYHFPSFLCVGIGQVGGRKCQADESVIEPSWVLVIFSQLEVNYFFGPVDPPPFSRCITDPKFL